MLTEVQRTPNGKGYISPRLARHRHVIKQNYLLLLDPWPCPAKGLLSDLRDAGNYPPLGNLLDQPLPFGADFRIHHSWHNQKKSQTLSGCRSVPVGPFDTAVEQPLKSVLLKQWTAIVRSCFPHCGKDMAKEGHSVSFMAPVLQGKPCISSLGSAPRSQGVQEQNPSHE